MVQNVARTWIWKPSGKIRPHQVPTALGPNWSNGSAKYSCYKLRSLLSYPPPVHLYHMFFVFGLYLFLIWRLRYPPLSLNYMSSCCLGLLCFLTNCFNLLLVFAFNSNGVIGGRIAQVRRRRYCLLFSVYMGSLGAQVSCYWLSYNVFSCAFL